jgi:hypothetical protein
LPLPADESGAGQVEALGVEDVAKLVAQRRLFSEQYAELLRLREKQEELTGAPRPRAPAAVPHPRACARAGTNPLRGVHVPPPAAALGQPGAVAVRCSGGVAWAALPDALSHSLFARGGRCLRRLSTR